MAIVPADAWKLVICFYRELIDVHGWHQTPMMDFVSWLAAQPQSQILHPSTSHEALGLAAVPTYQERLRRSMVYIVYSEPTGFIIHWQRGQGDEVQKESVPAPQSTQFIDRILAWLGTPEQRHAEQAAAPDVGA